MTATKPVAKAVRQSMAQRAAANFMTLLFEQKRSIMKFTLPKWAQEQIMKSINEAGADQATVSTTVNLFGQHQKAFYNAMIGPGANMRNLLDKRHSRANPKAKISEYLIPLIDAPDLEVEYEKAVAACMAAQVPFVERYDFYRSEGLLAADRYYPMTLTGPQGPCRVSDLIRDKYPASAEEFRALFTVEVHRPRPLAVYDVQSHVALPPKWAAQLDKDLNAQVEAQMEALRDVSMNTLNDMLQGLHDQLIGGTKFSEAIANNALATIAKVEQVNRDIFGAQAITAICKTLKQELAAAKLDWESVKGDDGKVKRDAMAKSAAAAKAKLAAFQAGLTASKATAKAKTAKAKAAKPKAATPGLIGQMEKRKSA